MQTDRALMERIGRRDGEAFDVLFDRYAPEVRRRIGPLVHDASAAEDLVQEVFLRLWTRAEQWTGQGPLGAWLGRIALNLARNHLRSHRRRRQRPLELPADAPGEDDALQAAWMVDPASPPPDRAAEAAERQALLASLIDGLPPTQRQVLRMVHQRELQLAEVARELGIPVGTVKSRLHYAIRQLTEQLRESGTEWEDWL